MIVNYAGLHMLATVNIFLQCELFEKLKLISQICGELNTISPRYVTYCKCHIFIHMKCGSFQVLVLTMSAQA